MLTQRAKKRGEDLTVSCPLCKSEQHTLLEDIDLRLLERLYGNFLGDVGDIFRGFTELKYYRCSSCDLVYFSPMITGPESFYAKLEKYDWYYPADKEEYSIAARYIEKDDSVLDIGSGVGMFSKCIPSRNYTGLELNRSAVEKAKEGNIHIVNELIEEHSAKFPEFYDVVCSFQVLEHVQEPNLFLRHALQALKPGGLLIIAVPSESSFLAYQVNHILNCPPHHVTRWTDQALRFIARIFDIEEVGVHHERLQPDHLQAYAQGLFLLSLCSLFGYKPRLIDDSFAFKVLNKLGCYGGALIAKALKPEMLPHGHTVIAVFRKKQLPA